MLDAFVKKHWSMVVTTAEVLVWITKRYKIDISPNRLAQHISKHEKFTKIGTKRGFAQYKVTNEAEEWMNGLV